MSEWTTPALQTHAGVVLHPRRLQRHVERRVADPPAVVGDVIERLWWLEWDVDDLEVPGSTLPDFCTHLTWESGPNRPGIDRGTWVTGATTRRFDARLRGAGRVVGVKFRPGAFVALAGCDAKALVDTSVPAAKVLPPSLLAAFTQAATSPYVDPAGVAGALAALPRPADARWLDAERAVRAADDDTVTTAGKLAERLGLGLRSLQRLTGSFVGLTPTQIVARRRLHDVVAALTTDPGARLADLAVRYGFYDQAHLTRAFTRNLGVPPAAYRAGDT